MRITLKISILMRITLKISTLIQITLKIRTLVQITLKTRTLVRITLKIRTPARITLKIGTLMRIILKIRTLLQIIAWERIIRIRIAILTKRLLLVIKSPIIKTPQQSLMQDIRVLSRPLAIFQAPTITTTLQITLLQVELNGASNNDKVLGFQGVILLISKRQLYSGRVRRIQLLDRSVYREYTKVYIQ